MRKSAALICVALAVSSPARAQDFIPFASIHAQGVMDGMRLDSALEDEPARAGAAASGAQVGGQPPRSTSSTAYQASPAVTAQVKRQYVDFIRQQAGPEGAAQVQRALEQEDFKAHWRQAVSSDGFKEGDAVDALASYWMLNWLIANGQTESTAAQAAAVRKQVRGVMASNPAMAKLSETQRQEMAEVLMLNFVMQLSAYGDAHKRGDRPLIGKLGEAAVARFRSEMDVDLRQLQLTHQGFVKRG